MLRQEILADLEIQHHTHDGSLVPAQASDEFFHAIQFELAALPSSDGGRLVNTIARTARGDNQFLSCFAYTFQSPASLWLIDQIKLTQMFCQCLFLPELHERRWFDLAQSLAVAGDAESMHVRAVREEGQERRVRECQRGGDVDLSKVGTGGGETNYRGIR